MAITSATLTALAGSDSGSVRIPLDEAIYSQVALDGFSPPHVAVKTERSEGRLWLIVEASDVVNARLNIGEALNALLKRAIRGRA